MIKVLGMFDSGSLPKVDYLYIESVLNQLQHGTDHPEQNIHIFIICTHSKRWREGKWKNKGWLNYAIRVPREAVDAMSKEEVSAWVIELAKKELKWGQAATAA